MYPDTQVYLCHDPDIAKKYKFPTPFRCACRRWIGDGCVSVEFYNRQNSTMPGTVWDEAYTVSEIVFIKTLEPILDDVSFLFNDVTWDQAGTT